MTLVQVALAFLLGLLILLIVEVIVPKLDEKNELLEKIILLLERQREEKRELEKLLQLLIKERGTKKMNSYIHLIRWLRTKHPVVLWVLMAAVGACLVWVASR